MPQIPGVPSQDERSQTANRSPEELADLLASYSPKGDLAQVADAEFRLREHRAILMQTEAAERQAVAAERAMQAAERQAVAAERSAGAAIRYTRYTFWIVLLTALIAAAALIGLRQALRSDRDHPAGPSAAGHDPHRQL